MSVPFTTLLIHPDVVLTLYKYLDIISIRALRVAVRVPLHKGASSVEPHAFARLRASLVRYFRGGKNATEAVDLIMEALATERYAITGSLALQCLTDGSWEPGDLDIAAVPCGIDYLAKHRYFYPFRVRLYENLVVADCLQPFTLAPPIVPGITKKMLRNRIGTFVMRPAKEGQLITRHSETEIDYSKVIPNFLGCYTCLCAGRKIQFLLTEHAKEQVAAFDLPICRNWMGFGNQIHVEAMADLSSRTTRVLMERAYWHGEPCEECLKQTEHGCIVSYVIEHLPSKYERLAKYRNRGYRICCHFDRSAPLDAWYAFWRKYFPFLRKAPASFVLSNAKRQKI